MSASVGRKRTPARPPTAPWDVYVSSRSRQGALVKRVLALVDDSPYGYAVVRGMGKALGKAVDVALAAQAAHGGKTALALSVTTGTAVLVDDLPDGTSRERLNSTIAITVFAPSDLGAASS